MKFLSMLLVGVAVAIAPNQANFKKVDLSQLQILDKDGIDNFQRKIKRAKITKALRAELEGQSYSKIVSPLYELDEQSSFKNIYVYVGQKDDGGFELVQAMVNKSGSIFIVDMDILDVEQNALKLQHGPSDDRQFFIASAKTGMLFK